MRSIPWLAYFLAVLNATIIGLSFMFTKVAVGICAPLDTLAFRFLIGAAVFLVYARAVKLELDFRGKNWAALIPIVLFYPLGFFTFQAYGLRHISSAEAGILTASAPMMTAILAALFIKERVNLPQFLSIGVSMFGVVYISWMKGSRIDPSQTLGIVLILLSCLSSAGYTICNRVLIRSFGAAEITFVLMSSGAVLFSGMAVAGHVRQGTLAGMLEPLRNPSFLAAVSYLGIFASLGTTILASLILKRISSAQLVVFFNLATIVAIMAGYVFLGESIRLYHLIGTAIILAGVIGTNYFKH